MTRVITFGTFDLIHIGHINILKRCKMLGDFLVVGVSSDSLNLKKGKESVYSENDRIEIIKSLRFVDEVFLEESLEEKDNYIKNFKADILVIGDDWKGKFDWVSCPVIYLPRTPEISTTEIKLRIAKYI
jgi:glycerol-3-phosphate cytidylyltransferase